MPSAAMYVLTSFGPPTRRSRMSAATLSLTETRQSQKLAQGHIDPRVRILPRDPEVIQMSTSPGWRLLIKLDTSRATDHTFSDGLCSVQFAWFQPHEISSSGSASGLVRMYSCRLRRHALSGVFRRHPVSGLIDVWLIGNIQCGSDDEIPVDPVESGQCDSCLTLVIHRSSNRVFHRLPRPLVVEGPGHPMLQIGPRILLGRLNRIRIAKGWRTQDQARRDDGHQMAHSGYPGNCSGPVRRKKGAARTTKFAVTHNLETCSPEVNSTEILYALGDWIRGGWSAIRKQTCCKLLAIILG